MGWMVVDLAVHPSVGLLPARISTKHAIRITQHLPAGHEAYQHHLASHQLRKGHVAKRRAAFKDDRTDSSFDRIEGKEHQQNVLQLSTIPSAQPKPREQHKLCGADWKWLAC